MMSFDDRDGTDLDAAVAWGEGLAKQVGSALASDDDAPMLALLEEVEPLVRNANDYFARLVTQAGLLRVIHGVRLAQLSHVDQSLDLDRFDVVFDEALEVGSQAALSGAALGAAGLLYGSRQEYRRAVVAHETAAARWASVGRPESEATELLRAGASAFHVESMGSALERSALARAAYERMGDTHGVIWATLNMAQAADRGDGDAARELVQEARALSIGLRDGHITCSILIQEGVLDAENGQHEAAKEHFSKAYRSARRRGAADQALVAAKNLGLLHTEIDQPLRAATWWDKTVSLAIVLSDWHEHQEAERARGVALARAGRYQDAVASFDRAIALNEDNQSSLDAARSRADKGAVLLEYALRGEVSDSRFDELVAQAISLLNTARGELEALGDFEWAATTLRNLRTAWTLQKTEADGAATLRGQAGRYGESAPAYAAELQRIAAWLALSAGSTDDEIWQLLRDAVAVTTDDTVEQAWALAKEAANLADRGFDDAAVHLYDAGLERLSPKADPSAFGNILNDSVIVLERLERLDEVRERLLVVEAIARESKDRVLLSLALSNLGETAVRQENKALARDYFTASVSLAEEIGDDNRVAVGLASIANTYVTADEVEEADAYSRRALVAAQTAGSDEAWLRATSATASVAYLRDDYEAAFTAWDQCVLRAGASDAGDYPAFALDSLAQIGDWPRFRRQLDRYSRGAQRAQSQAGFVEDLHLPALTWLKNGRPAAAGTVLAYSLLLAFEGASITYGPRGRELSTAERNEALTQISAPLGAARAIFVLLELPKREAQTVRRAYERTINRAAGDDAAILLETADRHIFTDPDDSSET
ncbi:tetratricopeptide repeat protein [Plantibacter sp. VKM Ac-2885]|uniref:tetratricopeptide repeat protein n=1 Tax=Plantibacter sp. VKM Ac-2885 TaxID=2783828 RepID=UPI00188A4495|nr:tetratricopeptide repeat protein [Plantibacter sp. VKM Ac-2885]MBF4511429.1 tetratricopeptide repeat protein [Plantibacter sp. VKM Ac-2885]